MRSDRPTRIVFVIERLEGGGAERHLVRLLGGLHGSGRWYASVYCLERTGPMVREIEEIGVRVIGPEKPLSKGPLRSAAALYGLIQYLRRERPAIVQSYLLHAGLIGALAARLAGVPNVVTTRRSVYMYRGLKLVQYRLTVALMDRCSDAVIAVSEAARGQAIEHGAPARKLVTIPNSVSMDRGPMHGRRLFEGSPVIGTVGYLRPIKGHRSLIEAAPAVLAWLPDTRFVVVGDGPERPSLERRARELGVADRISFLGERRDVPQLLSEFDIFALPSLSEGMPNAVLEAMAAGVVTVGTRVGGVPELIQDEHTGLLVEAGSPQGLAGALVRLARDKALCERCVSGARRLVAERYSPAREIGDTEALYLRLVDRSADGRCLRVERGQGAR